MKGDLVKDLWLRLVYFGMIFGIGIHKGFLPAFYCGSNRLICYWLHNFFFWGRGKGVVGRGYKGGRGLGSREWREGTWVRLDS